MLERIAQDLPTILICLVLAIIVAAIVVTLYRNHKKGKSSCGCGCSSCPMGDCCHPKKDAPDRGAESK